MTYCLLMAFLAFSSFLFVNLTLRWLMWMMAWMIRFVRYEIWMQMNECEMKFHLEVGQESALSRQCSCLLAAGHAAAQWRHTLAYLEWETHISSLAADVAATRSSIRCGMTKAWTSYFWRVWLVWVYLKICDKRLEAAAAAAHVDDFVIFVNEFLCRIWWPINVWRLCQQLLIFFFSF